MEAVPFTQDLRQQFDLEVSCLPYTISPFAMLDIAHSLPLQYLKVDDHLSFKPTSIKPNFVRPDLSPLLYPLTDPQFAVYPVLIPLYLAQYEYQIPGTDNVRTHTLFIEACSTKVQFIF